jgi:anti-sigma B factor antagonist
VIELAALFTWRRDLVVVAAITGELDLSNAADLELGIAGEVGNQAAGLVLDLGGLTFIDSSGVHTLFSLAERLRLRGRRIAVIAPAGGSPRRVLELSGPETRGWIADTVDEAVAAVLAGPRHN